MTEKDDDALGGGWGRILREGYPAKPAPAQASGWDGDMRCGSAGCQLPATCVMTGIYHCDEHCDHSPVSCRRVAVPAPQRQEEAAPGACPRCGGLEGTHTKRSCVERQEEVGGLPREAVTLGFALRGVMYEAREECRRLHGMPAADHQQECVLARIERLALMALEGI